MTSTSLREVMGYIKKRGEWFNLDYRLTKPRQLRQQQKESQRSDGAGAGSVVSEQGSGGCGSPGNAFRHAGERWERK